VLAVLVPLAVLEWVPAVKPIFSNGKNASVNLSYYQPLTRYLEAHSTPIGRVEIVPTRLHWEAAYVAPTVALARGWERQLDTADNPIFYSSVALTPTRYLDWLRDNGVRYVALPDVPVDYAGEREATLVRAGVAGLAPVWSDAHWHVYRVVGAPGIVTGPARLRAIRGGDVQLDVTAPGTITVRVRYSSHWIVAQGSGCLRPTVHGWTVVVAPRTGYLRLHLSLAAISRDAC